MLPSPIDVQTPDSTADVNTTIDLVLTYRHHDYSDLNQPELSDFIAAAGPHLSILDATPAIVAASFRQHLRISQSKILPMVLQALRASQRVVVVGEQGIGKSTFAGEVCDTLLAEGATPLYVNGEYLAEESRAGIGSFEAYCTRLFADLLQTYVQTVDGELMPSFLLHLARASKAFSGVQTTMTAHTSAEIEERISAVGTRNEWSAAIDNWISAPQPSARLRDLATYLKKMGFRFCLVVDNLDGLTTDAIERIGYAVGTFQSHCANSASVLLLVRPVTRSRLLATVSFNASPRQYEIAGQTEQVLATRCEFLSSVTYLEPIIGWSEIRDSNGELRHPALTVDLIGAVADGGRSLTALFESTRRSELSYYREDFKISNRPALDVIAAWHNYNNREIASSMLAYRERFESNPDKSTGVLRHLLTYGATQDGLLSPSLGILKSDVDIYHSSLTQLRWRLLQYMMRHPQRAFSASDLSSQFAHFNIQAPAIVGALDELTGREGLETGFVRIDYRSGEAVWNILPSGNWLASGLCHTVEYIFLTALSDPVFPGQRIVSGRHPFEYNDAERAELALEYMKLTMLPQFRNEHPYLLPDYNVNNMEARHKENLKEFARLFGYGVNRGWFLSRFLSALKSYGDTRGVTLSEAGESTRSEIKNAISRLNHAARLSLPKPLY